MIELIAGLALANYCRKQWKKAFPDVTKEELLTTIAEKEQQIADLQQSLADRASNTVVFILFFFAIGGWFTALWEYLQRLAELGR